MVAVVFAVMFGIIVGTAVAVVLFRPVFGNRAEFVRCVSFWLTPDIISLFKGQYSQDWAAEAKLGVWIAAGVLSGFGTYAGLAKLMG